MHFLKSLLLGASLPSAILAFPNVPFKTSGRWFLDSTGANFTYVGVNWPGHGEVMIPEGLQYQSIQSIVSKIKSLNMNVIRLTFAIEMVDDIKDNGGDVPVQKAFQKALGSNGNKIYQNFIKNNPQFNSSTTRLEVFDAVAAELSKQGIYVHLDNHMSKGKWCCGGNDKNAWFGDAEFDTAKWKRGLQYMAEYSKKWNNMISIGMRNEFRRPDTAGRSLPYNWQTWYDHNLEAANLINAANKDIIIFFSGLDYDTNLTPIPGAEDLGGGRRFQKSSFKYSDKIALELHNYQNSATDCNSVKNGLWNAGFKALDKGAKNQMPVVMTEFGFSQTDDSYTKVYATCLRRIIPEWDAGWTVWVLVGSYYIRSGTQDYEEAWGLLNHDWSDWRRKPAIDGLKQMIAASFR